MVHCAIHFPKKRTPLFWKRVFETVLRLFQIPDVITLLLLEPQDETLHFPLAISMPQGYTLAQTTELAGARVPG